MKRRNKPKTINSHIYRNMIEQFKNERIPPSDYGMQFYKIGDGRGVYKSLDGTPHEHEGFDWRKEPLECGTCILVYLYNKHNSIIVVAEKLGTTKANVWGWMVRQGVVIRKHAEAMI